MRVLFCGGGTAGHVMPALAICEIISKNFKNCEFAFVGRDGGNENRIITKKGYKLYTIKIHGIERKISKNSIKSIFSILKCSRSAKEILFDFKPDIIIGTGGYVCYPIIRQGQRKKIKTFIHESNIYPGLVTRLLGKKCDALLLSSAGALEYLQGARNTVITGNPVRSDFRTISREEARRKLGINDKEFFIVSFGGSLGAEIINKNVIALMEEFSAITPNVKHLHAVGRKHFESAKVSFPHLCRGTQKCRISDYIDDMPLVLKAADLAITRSGAMTISELACSGTPAILVPSPNVTANHQFINAKYLADRNAALLIEESDLNTHVLLEKVRSVFKSHALRKNLSQNIKTLYPDNAEKRIVATIKSVFC